MFQQIGDKGCYMSELVIQARENSIEQLASICQTLFLCFNGEKLLIQMIHVAVGIEILLALKIGVIGFDDALRGVRVNIFEDDDP